MTTYAELEAASRAKYLRGCADARRKYATRPDDLPATVDLMADRYASECEYYLDQYHAETDVAWINYGRKAG